MANTFMDAYLRYMDSKGIKYRTLDDRCVRVAYNCENIKTVAILVLFDKNGKNLVQFVCTEVANFKDNKYAAGLVLCNSLNAKYRWCKFYLDKDSDLLVEADALVEINTVGSECAEMVSRMVDIIDGAYPDIMRANLNLN